MPAGAGKLAADEARHDLAQGRGVILGLAIALDALDAERAEIGAQPRQRALVQEAGQIVRRVGQQLAAAEPDEQVEVFALDALDGGLARGLRQRGMCDAERRRVAAQPARRSSSFASGARDQQRGQQRVFLRARRRDIVEPGCSPAP